MAIDLNQEPLSNYFNEPKLLGLTVGEVRRALMVSQIKGGTIEAYKKGWTDAVNVMQKQLNRMIEDIK